MVPASPALSPTFLFLPPPPPERVQMRVITRTSVVVCVVFFFFSNEAQGGVFVLISLQSSARRLPHQATDARDRVHVSHIKRETTVIASASPASSKRRPRVSANATSHISYIKQEMLEIASTSPISTGKRLSVT